LEPYWLRSIGPAYDPGSEPERDACAIVLPEAFDVLIYFDQTTPSVLLE
jgi:erythromycin esterase-like protein